MGRGAAGAGRGSVMQERTSWPRARNRVGGTHASQARRPVASQNGGCERLAQDSSEHRCETAGQHAYQNGGCERIAHYWRFGTPESFTAAISVRGEAGALQKGLSLVGEADSFGVGRKLGFQSREPHVHLRRYFSLTSSLSIPVNITLFSTSLITRLECSVTVLPWPVHPAQLHPLNPPNYFFFFFFFWLFRAVPKAYGSSQLGVKSELQLPAYTTGMATPDPSRVCDLHHSSRQCRLINPLSEARDRTHILMDTRQVCDC